MCTFMYNKAPKRTSNAIKIPQNKLIWKKTYGYIIPKKKGDMNM